MTKRGIAMHRLREILRLHYDLGLTDRAISRALGVSHATVADIVRRFERSPYTWPVGEDLADSVLHQRLYPGNVGRPRMRPEPDWATVHQELRRKGVTLETLWREYRAVHATGYEYSQFCAHYRQYQRRVDLVLRKIHLPGQHCYVDYAGPTVPILDPKTGMVQSAQVFVAVLGYSNYTFADLHPQQTTAWWIRGHVDAFAYFHGVPRIIVPDNAKPLVTKAERFEVTLNRTYQAFATHYGVAIVPARVRKPRDKGPAEAGVLLVERWILAHLRHEQFVSWDTARARVRMLLDRLNAHPFQKLPGSRASLWQEERPALRPLPIQAFDDESWRVAKVHPDYHIEVDHHYYSVPFRLVGERVDVRVTATLVECFHDHLRVASHPRLTRDVYHTVPEHMPPAHRAMTLDWNPDYFRQRAAAIGPDTARLIDMILDRAVVPEQVFRRCQGILALAQRLPVAQFEAVAQRAITAGSVSYRAVKAFCGDIADPTPERSSPGTHANVRGATYFQAEPESV